MRHNIKKPIYLDYMASTPIDPRVAKKMSDYLTYDYCANSGALHFYGQEVSKLIENARIQVAELIHAEPNEIIWTSGATEANNLALFGAARFYQRKGKHIITVKTEHEAVLRVCQQLESEGFEVTYLSPQSNGLINLKDLELAIKKETILVSIMHVNNEIGVIQPVQDIAELLRSKGIVFHMDAAQSAGKLEINIKTLPVDLLSISAHKLYGPKGIGALYLRRNPRTRLLPLFHGGGQENGLRSGTLATHQIIAMGEACVLAKTLMSEDRLKVTQLRDLLWSGIQDIPDIILNGDWESRISHNINVSVQGVEGSALILALKELAISNASACRAASMEPSYVLQAIGRSPALAHSAIRLSMGRFSTIQEIEQTVKILKTQIQNLRNLSPL